MAPSCILSCARKVWFKFYRECTFPMVLHKMVAHFTMHTHGVCQAFRYLEGIWIHRKSRQIHFFFVKDLIYILCAQHVLSYHLIYVTWQKLFIVTFFDEFLFLLLSRTKIFKSPNGFLWQMKKYCTSDKATRNVATGF